VNSKPLTGDVHRPSLSIRPKLPVRSRTRKPKTYEASTGTADMDEYDRWYKGYMFRRRMARDAKLIAYVVLGTLAVIGLVNVIARLVAS
jgi:hypothetical protein